MLGAGQDGAGVPRLDDGAVVEDDDVLAGGGGGQVGGDEKQARLRAGIIGSQVGGLIMARYIVGIEVIAALSDDEVIAIYGPILQRLIEMPLETGTAQ